MSNIEYCEKKIAKPGTDFYYSVRFITKAQREALIILYAVCKEIQDIPFDCTDDDVAEKKLNWWAAEIDKMFSGTPQHPASCALLPIAQKYALPKQLFTELIEGTKLKLTSNHCCTEQDFALYAYREYGIPMALSTYIIKDDLKYIQPMANALAILDCIVNCRHMIRNGYCFFPLDELEKFELTPAILQEMKMQDSLVQFFNAQLSKAKEFIASANSQEISNTQPFVAAKLKLIVAKKYANTNFPVFEELITLTPIRKLFTAITTYFFKP